MLRREDEVVLAAADALDKVSNYFDRKERTQREKDIRYGVTGIDFIDEKEAPDADTEQSGIVRAMYWDVLRELPREDALVLVLRYCMGYACTEISAGLGITYASVKYKCRARL